MSDVNTGAANPADVPDYAAEIARLSGESIPEKPEVVATPEPVANTIDSDTFDPATLPPSVKSKWDAMQTELENERRRAHEFEGKYAKIHGQVSPLQRELNRLKSQPATAKAAPAKQATAQPFSKETLKNWMKHAKDYPEESSAIEEYLEESLKAKLRDELGRFQPIPEDIAALRKELADLKEQQLKPLIEAREYETTKQAQSTVFEAHPDWNDHIQYKEVDGQVVVSHLSDALSAWAEKQPARIVDMFGSEDPEECKWVMSYFKDSLKATQVEQEARAETAQQTAASEIQKQREKNLQSRAVASTSGVGMARVDPSKMSDAERYELDMKKLMG